MDTSRLRRRLLPLQVATLLQAMAFWVPVEKLFMSEIGFTPATVGVMAAAYAAVVPVLELPAGVLADRWSRRLVLAGASVASAACALVGGISHGVTTYIVAALFLGAYFALYSGALDSILYDTVLEELGRDDTFEAELGRLRALESAGFVASALLGGWLAEVVTVRAMYFLTIPFVIASCLGYLLFREPQLHRSDARGGLREHLATTSRTLTRTTAVGRPLVLSLLAATAMTLVFEFGPLWLVEFGVSPATYGPQWAVLMATLGFGGLAVRWLDLERTPHLAFSTALLVTVALALTASRDVVLVTAAQGTLVLLAVVLSVHATALLHRAISSDVRSSVSSGVSTATWLVFLPVALLFGAVAEASGVQAAAWILVGLAVVTTLVLVLGRRAPAPALVVEPMVEESTACAA